MSSPSSSSSNVSVESNNTLSSDATAAAAASTNEEGTNATSVATSTASSPSSTTTESDTTGSTDSLPTSSPTMTTVTTTTESSNSTSTTNQEGESSTTTTTIISDSSVNSSDVTTTAATETQFSASPSSAPIVTVAVSTVAPTSLPITEMPVSPPTALPTSSEEGVPNLPFGDINILILTDVHSWVGGHGFKEAALDADYGHVLSFYQRLKEYCTQSDKDLWFVMNGDWIDGTGLAMNGDPSHLVQILQKMPWDAVNIGNHELYSTKVLDFILQPGGFVEWWGDRYLSSNIFKRIAKASYLNNDKEEADFEQQSNLEYDQEPVGSKYHILNGKNGRVIVFGFLYNMKDNVDSVYVQEVQDTVQEEWFTNALLQPGGQSQTFDAVLVLSHMDVRDQLVNVILDKIRSLSGYDQIPILFVTGHTHIRSVASVDHAALSFEAGRFLDTIGFISIPNKATLVEYVNDHADSDREGVKKSDANATARLFQYRYLDANVKTLRETLRITDESSSDGEVFDTPDGAALSQFINRTQTEMGLHKIVACVDKTYYRIRSLNEEDSLWGLFINDVVYTQFQESDVVLLGQGIWRYDLVGGGHVRVDDVIAVSPYNDSLYSIPNIPASIILQLNKTLNDSNGTTEIAGLPQFILASTGPIIEDAAGKQMYAEQESDGTVVDMDITPTPVPVIIEEKAVNQFANGSLEQEVIEEDIEDPVDAPSSQTGVYNIITNAFILEYIQAQLVDLYPDALEISPVPINKTTLGLWLHYLHFDHPQCANPDQAIDVMIAQSKNASQHTPLKPSLGPGVTPSHTDSMRLGFAACSFLMVLCLLAVHVKQRSAQFQRYSQQRERESADALREFHEEEGEFVQGIVA